MPAKSTPNRAKRPQPRGRQPRKLPLVPIVVGLVVLLGVVAVVISRGGSDEGGGDNAAGIEETRPVSVTGEALAPHGEGEDAAVGSLAPELAGAAFDGTPVTIAEDGRPKVLVFLAHWCPHCQAEVPVLAEWLSENGAPEGVDLYGVATSTTRDRPNFPPSAWLEREGWTIPTLADAEDSRAAQAFGLSSFPYFVAVDSENRVVARTSGELTVQQWEALIDEARA